MKTLIIYHSADFDGTLSRDVCIYWLRRSKREHEVTTFGWNYGDPVPVIGNWDLVYLVDISIPELLVDANRDRIVWIDHHKTAIDRHGDEWMGIRIDGVAACRLCYQWFLSGEAASACPTLEMFQRRYVNEPILGAWPASTTFGTSGTLGLTPSSSACAVPRASMHWITSRSGERTPRRRCATSSSSSTWARSSRAMRRRRMRSPPGQPTISPGAV